MNDFWNLLTRIGIRATEQGKDYLPVKLEESIENMELDVEGISEILKAIGEIEEGEETLRELVAALASEYTLSLLEEIANEIAEKVGEKDAAAQTDHTQEDSAMAFLKGIVELLSSADEDIEELRKIVELQRDMVKLAEGKATGNSTTSQLEAEDADAFEDGKGNVIDLTGEVVIIVRGKGAGQVRAIESNTANTLDPVTDFDEAPNTSSQFVVLICSSVKYGQLTENPQEFTMLGRLKALQDLLAGTLTAQLTGSNVELYADTLTFDNEDSKQTGDIPVPDSDKVLIVIDNKTSESATVVLKQKVNGDYIEFHQFPTLVGAGKAEVLGPVQAFPRFDDGRIDITLADDSDGEEDVDIVVQEV